MYLITNQDGYFLGKSGQWLDGRETATLYRTSHKDEALNQLFETNSRDFSLRLTLMECDINPKGLPVIPPEQLPPPLPKAVSIDNKQPPLLDALAS